MSKATASSSVTVKTKTPKSGGNGTTKKRK